MVDVCRVLSSTDNSRRYWSDLKRKLKSEGVAEVYEKIVHLKMKAPDGKQRLTDAASIEQLLRIMETGVPVITSQNTAQLNAVVPA